MAVLYKHYVHSSTSIVSREYCFSLLFDGCSYHYSANPPIPSHLPRQLERISQQICLARTLSTLTTTLAVVKSVRWSYSCTGLDRLPGYLDSRHTRWLSCQPQKISLALFFVKGWVRPERLSVKNPQWSHCESNPRPFCLQRTASINCSTAYPIKICGLLDIVDLKYY